MAAALGGVVLIGLLRCESFVKYTFHRIAYACPHCHTRKLPRFRCSNPSCGVIHDDLVSSIHGILTAGCGQCGSDLPTTDLSGRLTLAKICPNCGTDLDDREFGHRGEYHVAVVGATSAGKSNLMTAAIWKLESAYAPQNSLRIEFANPHQERIYRDWVRMFASGQQREKTAPVDQLSAFNVTLSSTRGSGGRLYLYDPAGEHYEQGETGLVTHHYQKHIDALFFVIDPFAEADFRRTIPPLNRRRVNAADVDATEIFSQLLPIWEKSMHRTSAGKLPIPIAVVLSKVDAGGLDKRMPIDELQGHYATTEVAAAIAIRNSDRVREFLRENGLSGLVANIEGKFERVSYFASTALGRSFDSSDSSPFRPRGVLEPLLWLCHVTGALSEGSPVERARRNFVDFVRRCFEGREGLTAWYVAVGLSIGLVGGVLWCVRAVLR
jgi:hypothetical protein